MALDCSGTRGVGVAAVVVARSSAIEVDFEAEGLAIFCGAKNQVQIARVKAEDDFAGGCIEDRTFGAYFPGAAQRPLIQSEARLRNVGHAGGLREELGGSEVLGAVVSGLGFGRASILQVWGSFRACRRVAE